MKDIHFKDQDSFNFWNRKFKDNFTKSLKINQSIFNLKNRIMNYSMNPHFLNGYFQLFEQFLTVYMLIIRLIKTLEISFDFQNLFISGQVNFVFAVKRELFDKWNFMNRIKLIKFGLIYFLDLN